MSEPIVFISRNRIREGKIEDFRKHYQDSLASIITGKPGTSLQLAYENEDGTEAIIIRLFPNAESLDLQIEGAEERSKKTYEFIEPVGIEIFGRPGPSTLERMRKIAGAGIMVNISPLYLGGFFR